MSIGSAIKGELAETAVQALSGNRTSLSDGGPNLIFPSDLEIYNRPYIRFSCHSNDSNEPLRHICLPCPPGIQFSDGGEYSSINMGKIAAVADMTRAAMEGYQPNEGIVDKLGGALKGATLSARDQILSGGAIGAGILAARKLGFESIAEGIEFTNRKVINPRTNTSFSGNTLRTFEFSFKLIGSSRQEVESIRQIQKYFQEQIYAQELGGQKVMLKYPNQWRIQFMSPSGVELTHIPKIYTSYLTSCNTQINSTGATFRKDMSPYEVDVSLSFQEAKILTRNELAALNNEGNRTNADLESVQEIKKDFENATKRLLGALQNESSGAPEELQEGADAFQDPYDLGILAGPPTSAARPQAGALTEEEFARRGTLYDSGLFSGPGNPRDQAGGFNLGRAVANTAIRSILPGPF